MALVAARHHHHDRSLKFGRRVYLKHAEGGRRAHVGNSP